MDLFKNRLKEIRQSKGITVNKLSKAIGVKPATISYYENGKRYPSIKHLLALSDYFNVTIDYLCGKDILNNPTNITAEERLNIILTKHPILYDYITKDPRKSVSNLEKLIINLSNKKVASKSN